MKRLITSGILVLGFYVLGINAQTAQPFHLYFANNIGDVKRVSKITQDDTQLKWNEVTNGMVAGNKADVTAVQQMFASKRQKNRADQQLFWKMRDDNLLCFRINDGKGKSGEYEVRVQSTGTKQLKKNVTSYFFVNTDYHQDVISVLVNPKNCGPNDTLRFKYYIDDWRNDDLLLFKLDSRRRLSGLTYQLEYVMQNLDHTKESTGRLNLSGSSFQSFYMPSDSLLTAVYLVSEGKNRIALDMKRLVWGANLSDRLNGLWLNDNFTLDKHANRELTIFNMLGSGLFEQYDTLFLTVAGDKGTTIKEAADSKTKLASEFTFNIVEVDEKGQPVKGTQKPMKYVGYNAGTGTHKLLTYGNPAYIEVIHAKYFPAVFKYAGALDPKTHVLIKDRTAATIRLIPREKDKPATSSGPELSSMMLYGLKDMKRDQSYNGKEYKVFAVDSIDLMSKSSSSEFNFIEDGGWQSKPKLVNGKPVDKYAEIMLAYSVPANDDVMKYGATLSATPNNSSVGTNLPKTESVVLNARDYTGFRNSYCYQRWNLVGQLKDKDIKYKPQLTIGEKKITELPYLTRKEMNDGKTSEEAKAKLKEYAFTKWEIDGEATPGFSFLGRLGEINIKGAEKLPGLRFVAVPFIDFFKGIFEVDMELSYGGHNSGTTDNPSMGDRMRKNYKDVQQLDRFKIGNEFGKGDYKATAGVDWQNRSQMGKHNEDKWLQAEMDDIFKVKMNKLGVGWYVDIKAGFGINWSKKNESQAFYLKQITGTIGYGAFLNYAWDLKDSPDPHHYNDWLKNLDKWLQFKLEINAEASIQATFGIKSFTFKNKDVITNRKYGFFVEPRLQGMAGISLTAQTHWGDAEPPDPAHPEKGGEPSLWRRRMTNLFYLGISGRAGAKLMTKYAGVLYFHNGHYDHGACLLPLVAMDFSINANIGPLAKVSLYLAMKIGGRYFFWPNDETNPTVPTYPNYKLYEDKKARQLSYYWPSLMRPSLTPRLARASQADLPKFNLGEGLMERIDAKAQPRFLGPDRFIMMHNNLTTSDLNDDAVMEFPVSFINTNGEMMTRKDGAALSDGEHMQQNHSVVKEGEMELVVCEEMTKKASLNDDMDAENDQMRHAAIIASIRQTPEGAWTQQTVAYDESVIDNRPVAAINLVTAEDVSVVSNKAVCVWRRGHAVSIATEEELAAEAPDEQAKAREFVKESGLRAFEGDLMMSVYDGEHWGQPEKLFSFTKNDLVKDYQVVMVNDTVLTAVSMMPQGRDSLELRYYCKPYGEPARATVTDKMTPIDFSLDMVGFNPFIAILHAPDSVYTDIYVKAIDMKGEYMGYGADLDLNTHRPMSVRLVADKDVDSPDDFAVLWEKMDNSIRQKGQYLQTDSTQVMLNCSRVYMRENLEAVPFVTLGCSTDQLKMSGYDVFLNDEIALALFTLTNPATGETYLLRNTAEFTKGFKYGVGYSQSAMLDETSMPVEVTIYNTGDSPIIDVEGSVNDQEFKFSDVFINPYGEQTFTVDYQLPENFNGLLRAHDFRVVFGDYTTMANARRRASARRVVVADQEEEVLAATGYSDVRCELVSQQIEGKHNTVCVELTDLGGLKDNETLYVGLYPSHVADEPIATSAEVTLHASDFETQGAFRKAWVELTADNLDEEQEVYLRARVYNDDVLRSLTEDDDPTDAVVTNQSWVDNLCKLTLLPSELDDITGLPVVKADTPTSRLSVQQTSQGLWVSGLEGSDCLRVFNVEAMPVFVKHQPDNREFVPLHAPGVYLLSTGNKVVKVRF